MTSIRSPPETPAHGSPHWIDVCAFPDIERFVVHMSLNGQNHILRRKHRLDDKIMYMREGGSGNLKWMERKVTHAAETFSVEREERGKS